MRVAVIAEFYPRASDPVLGIWAHRQAVAARDAGAEVEVFVLHRVVPPLAAARRGAASALRATAALVRQPSLEWRDGIGVRYVRYASPPRALSYAHWGAWAAPTLRRALAGTGDFDLIHAHNAVPTADAVLRAATGKPLVVSVHGGDLFHTALRRAGLRPVRRALAAARIVLANSEGVASRCRDLGAGDVRVVHLGAATTGGPRQPAPGAPVIVTLAHLVARKRHADVIRAVARLSEAHPDLRYRIVGDGPQSGPLRELAASLGVAERVEFTGQLAPAAALTELAGATAMVMPSVDEAFGVAYVEALAVGVPAIGSDGEPGPADIAAAGDGIELVTPGDIPALARAIERVVADARGDGSMRAEAIRTGARFSWERCATDTLTAYRDALDGERR